MSSKTKATTVKPDGKPALTPKLRFPEFRDTEGWESKPLGTICEILNNRRRPITSDQRVAGPYPYYGASGIVDFVGEFIFDERLLLVGEDGAKWEAFEKTAFIAEGKYWVNNHAHVLKPTEVNDTLLENYLTMADLGPFVTGAAPPKLTLGKLKGIPVPVPPSAAEQQKIADCLSSLDELIGAEGRKLDALKSHKKGLMQQLFPREGETRPRLRFPEFQNAPEWTGKPMGKVYSFKGNNSLTRDQLNYEHGSVKNIHYGDIHTKFATRFDITKETVPFINPSVSLDGFRPENDCVEGDMIFADASEDLEDVGKSIEVVRLNGERVVSGQHTILARPKDKSLVVGFGAYLFKSKRVRAQIQKESQGAKVLGISATRLTKIDLPIPSTKAEQQRIASCLSFLDDLISVQSDKIEVLKTHKKGLMQQLFPSPAENAA